MFVSSTLRSRYWGMEPAVGKGRLGEAENSCTSSLRPLGPTEIPNCRHKGNAKKGQPPSSQLFPYHFIGLSLLLLELAQSYRSVYLTRLISEQRLGWREDFVLGQCLDFVTGTTLPSLHTCPLLVLQTQTHTPPHTVNSSTTRPIQRQGENFFTGAKPTRIRGESLK